jgi:hypothetical protein
MPFAYSVFGLRLHSEIPLPELFEEPAGGVADVSISVGRLPEIEGGTNGRFVVTPEGAILNVPEAGRYLMRNGREILVEPGESERHMRLYLLGSAFGAILHQRGLLPLHANSIAIGGRAVAFLGHSGAGKSTMAAWFHDRGFEVLADDVCVVTFEEGRPIAHPGIPRLRMWRDALEASGRSAEAYQLAFDDAEKYNVPTRTKERGRPLELGAIYLLKKGGEDPATPLIDPLSGIEALDALVSNTYRGAYVRMLGGTQAHLASCLSLVKATPIFAINRLWGKEHLEPQLRQMEQHARGVVENRI